MERIACCFNVETSKTCLCRKLIHNNNNQHKLIHFDKAMKHLWQCNYCNCKQWLQQKRQNNSMHKLWVFKKFALAGSGLVFWLLSIQLFKLLGCPGHSVGCAAKLGLNTSDHYFHGILQIWSFWEGLNGLSLC